MDHTVLQLRCENAEIQCSHCDILMDSGSQFVQVWMDNNRTVINFCIQCWGSWEAVLRDSTIDEPTLMADK